MNPRTPKSVNKDVDWNAFRTWLYSQYVKEYANDIIYKAAEYKDAIFDPTLAARFKSFTLSNRKRALKVLSALSKFMGCYDTWRETMKKADLHWEKESPASIVRALLSEEALAAYQWLKDSLAKIPVHYRPLLIYIAVSGLRPTEAYNSHKLVYSLSQQGKLNEYYDTELSMLQHFKYPDLFLRNTKNCFISFVSPKMVETLAKSKPYNYDTSVEPILESKGCKPVQTYSLRKYYATTLKASMDRELIDLVQGRLDPSIFVKHYYRPILLDLRDKVLRAVSPIENELAAFLSRSSVPSLVDSSSKSALA